MATSKREQRNKWIVVVVGTLFLVFLYFFFMNNNEKKAKETKISEEVKEILDTDIEMDYPGTPKELIILYNKIIACYYERKLDDKTLEKLVGQERILFDQELLDNNTFEDQMKDLKAEISDYRKVNRVIIGSAVAKSNSVDYYKKGEKEYASIVASYTLKDKEVKKTYERFTLRKDDNGKWRILGWEITSPVDLTK